MIKFFRHIRQNLIMKNKTGKYFKYAIGEIILVVIGILIALQINNFNESRKLEKSKQSLMLALKNELIENKNSLNRFSLELNKRNSKFNKVLRYSVGDYTIPDDSLKYYISNMVYERTLSTLNSVQEEAINSGKFEMLSDTLKQSLSLLKDYTNSRKSLDDISIEILNFNSNYALDKIVAILSILPVIPDELSSHPIVPKHPEFLLSNKDLSTLLKNPKTYLILNKIYLLYATDEVWIKHGLLKVTENTIDLIDEELNTL